MSSRFDPTEIPDGAGAGRAASAAVVADRYELGDQLGRGGTGTVYRARDRVTDRPLAIKFVDGRTPGELRQLRRELTVLRLLDLPGVVRLHDDGVDGGQTFLVMDLLEGGTFDRLADRGPWETWRDGAFALLEALARVHFAGVVHRDLKPGNVLLDASGRPVLTDFGLATGAAVESEVARLREGTPRYMAPEQRAGEPCDARTDLYAIGVMLDEMLSRSGGAPPEVEAVVAAMRAERPDDRPDAAVDVLAALGAGTERVLGADIELPEVADAAALEALFAEPEVSFLHLAEDGAAELLARTGGAREAVRQELDRWVRAGLAHWSDDGLEVTRPALEALAWERDPRRAELLAAVAKGVDAGREAALALAAEAHGRGETGRALAVLEPLATSDEDAVAVQLTVLSLASQQVARIKHAAYLAERHRWPACHALLRAAQEALHGDPVRGHEALVSLGALRDRGLEGWRIALGVYTASHAAPDAVDGWLGAGEAWAGSDNGRRARVATWRGRVAYSHSAFDEALSHELEAVQLASSEVDRLNFLANAAAAALEVPDLERATELAARARTLARRLRHALVECNVLWVLRTVAYRRGQPESVDQALVRAAERVSPALAANFALTDAATAWRQGDHPLARELADAAASAFEALRFADGALLCRALTALSGGPEPELRVDELASCHPVIVIQVLAMCVMIDLPVPDVAPPADLERYRGRMLNVLTGDECVSALARA